MTAFQPVLYLGEAKRDEMEILRPLDDVSTPVSLSTSGEYLHHHPGGRPSVSFFPDGFQQPSIDLAFAKKFDMLPSRSGPRPEVPGLDHETRDEVIARFYRLITSLSNTVALFVEAYDNSGFTGKTRKLSADQVRFHVFDAFIAMSMKLTDVPGLPPLRALPGQADAPDTHLGLAVTLFHDQPMSRHLLLSKMRLADTWLSGLARREGWPQPCPIQIP